VIAARSAEDAAMATPLSTSTSTATTNDAERELCVPASVRERSRAPGLLVVGGMTRDAGKTELACDLLRRFGRDRDVAGVKVTTVRANGAEAECPRGAAGCGACSSFEGEFIITEERDFPLGKDTSRLKEAGASRVLWLRARPEALAEGFEALRLALGPGALAVCESNSVRAVVDPDLFLMLRRDGEPGRQGAASSCAKASARAVAGFADRVVRSDRRGFDLDLDAIDVAEGRWRLHEPATAIVLAGGRSGRMGQDKRALPIAGRSLIERVVAQLRPHVREVLIGANDEAVGEALGLRTVRDHVEGQGPLMGLASCLAVTGSDRNLVVACDLPEIPADLSKRLLLEGLAHDAAVPRGPSGIEPLLALYRRRLLPDAVSLLAAGERRVRPLYEGRDVLFLDLAELGVGALPNLNTRQEYEAYLKRGRGG
jgi:molybdenum cofactor guanylyltransferase